MNSRLAKRISVLAAMFVVLGAIVVTYAQTADASAAENDASRGRSIVGVWKVTVQQYDCQSQAPIGNPFNSLLTFNEGGTMTGSTTNPGFAAGQRGPDHGVWKHEGGREYSAKSIALLAFTTLANPPFNPGFQAGSQTITQSIKLDEGRDQFTTSDAAVQFFDATGKSYRQGCASATGQRFE